MVSLYTCRLVLLESYAGRYFHCDGYAAYDQPVSSEKHRAFGLHEPYTKKIYLRTKKHYLID